jgi:hypothetical protein
MYTTTNFKSKKALKDAVASGKEVGVYQNGLGSQPPLDGQVAVEGPHYPAPHAWYAQVTLKGGLVVKVKDPRATASTRARWYC